MHHESLEWGGEGQGGMINLGVGGEGKEENPPLFFPARMDTLLPSGLRNVNLKGTQGPCISAKILPQRGQVL